MDVGRSRNAARRARCALGRACASSGFWWCRCSPGFATTPYAAFHFHRLAPYGVLANLLAMPVVSAWVMPMGILGVLAMPFGFDAFFWRLMGEGIDWMIAVALWVASLPGAVGRMAAFGTGPLLLGSAGLVVLCLLRSPLRIAGVALFALATVWAVRTPQPDVLIAADGTSFAVRTAQRPARHCQDRQRHIRRAAMACGRRAMRASRPTRRWARGSSATTPAASGASRTAR